MFQKKPTAEYSNGLANEAAPWLKVADQKNINPKTGEAVTHKVNEFLPIAPATCWVRQLLQAPCMGGNEYTIEPTGDLNEAAGRVGEGNCPSNVFTPPLTAPATTADGHGQPDGVQGRSYYIDDGRIMQRGEDVMGDKTATV